jgi:nucleoside-diphosphate-sugar epimerase
MIEQLKGPILVLGAGGFIGINLLRMLLRERKDVFGVSTAPRTNWRMLECHTPRRNVLACDIKEPTLLRPMLQEVAPRTVFQLSAYGAYSSQREYSKIYRTNFNSVVDLIEMLKETGFDALIQAGSNSEYGLNAAGPKEEDELRPNSHYAVSKVATHYALKYYGQVERLPVVNLRIYSAYGPWEEPDRLIPQLLHLGAQGRYPKFSNPNTSRDFVHVEDICKAFIQAALRASSLRGEAFNIGTGRKTTLKELAGIARELFQIENTPVFGNMPGRAWDVDDWYGEPAKAERELGWKAEIKLEEGLRRTAEWQKEVDFAEALWNWTTNQ